MTRWSKHSSAAHPCSLKKIDVPHRSALVEQRRNEPYLAQGNFAEQVIPTWVLLPQPRPANGIPFWEVILSGTSNGWPQTSA